jgi:hypothetical protein
LVCINDAIETRRFGAIKRGIGTFVSAQDTDGLGIRTFYLLIVCLINDLQRYKWFYLDSNNVESTSVHGVGSVWATMLWDLTWAYISKYGYNDNKYTGDGGTIRSCSLSLMV